MAQGGRKPSRGNPRGGNSRGGNSRDGNRRGGRDDRRGGDGRGRPQSGRKDDRRKDDRRGGAARKPSAGRGVRDRDQEVYDGPPLADDITGKELAPNIRSQLKGLPEKLAARVARHLVAAGQFVESDPETAYRHAKAARTRAPRLAVVREALGETAYAAGHYSEALSELRAAKRMNGATAYLPIMADCHRALGNPARALELAKSPSVAKFPAPAKAEMTIVEAGARRDLGQVDAALRTLELAPLQSKSRDPWVVRLRYAYADALVDAGRGEDALTWFHRTVAIDGEEITDAQQRAAELERSLGR